MPGRPGRRVTRLQYWRRRLRGEKDPLARLAHASEFFRAIAAAGDRTIPQTAQKAVADMTDRLIEDAEALAKKIPADELEKGGARR